MSVETSILGSVQASNSSHLCVQGRKMDDCVPRWVLKVAPEVGTVGGYGVFFHHDVAAYIPLQEEQTNIRRVLEGHRARECTLICLDRLVIVKGVSGWA